MNLKQMQELLDEQAAKMAERGSSACKCGHPECDQLSKMLEGQTNTALEMIFGETSTTHAEKLRILHGFLRFVEEFDRLNKMYDGDNESLAGVLEEGLESMADTIVKQHYRDKYEKL